MKLTGSITRPADTSNYSAGDAINSATTAVKQKDTVTLSGQIAAKKKHIVTLTNGAPVKQKQTISFAGTAPTKQKETITVSGSSGTMNITLAGYMTKLATYRTNPTTTASDFVTAHAEAYLEQNIVVTSDGADLIFESYAIGQNFVAPVVVQLTGNLAGAVAHTTAWVPISVINLTGDSVGFELTIDDAIATALATFVSNNETSFLGYAIVLTSDGSDLILEAETAGEGFVEFTTDTTTGNIEGTSATTQANVPAGAGYLGLPSLLMHDINYDTDLGTTAAAFASDHAAAFDALGVAVTASTTTVIFEAKVAGVTFEKPVFQNTAGTLAGSVADTTANRVTGTASISCAGVTKTSTFVTDATTTAAAFVTANATDYSAVSVVVTSLGADLIFEAAAAGVPFDSPVFTNLTGTFAGAVVHTTANTSVAGLELTGDAAEENGGEGSIERVWAKTTITQFAAKTVRMYLYDSMPTGTADNAAFSITNRASLVAEYDILFGALVAGSAFVTGEKIASKQYKCASASKKLYAVFMLPSDAIATPTNAGILEVEVYGKYL